MSLQRRQIESVVAMALEEDAPFGDVTSQTFVPATTTATAELVAREPGIFAGAEVFEVAMIALDDTVKVTLLIADGDHFDTGQVLARVEGSARAILQAERVALNLVQRMCGVATLTARYVEAVAGTDARVVDTRKTTPGLRALERHAVRCGGGHNHRYSLSDAVMAKDNHLAVVDDIGAAIRRARAELPHTMHLEVEVDRLEQLDEVLAAGPDTIMLDNFSLDDLVEGVRRIDGRAIVEASGGITLDTIAAVAATGVDVISVGALTHSVRALDLGSGRGRRRFAMTYLDAAATTPVRREVLEAMWPYLTTTYGNPSSHHEVGEAAARGLEAARRAVADILGARPAEITFTSGGTEGANTAIKGIALASPRGRHVIVSAVEHPAVLESARWLGRLGYDVTELGVDADGRVAPADLAAALRPDTTLVSIQYANNEVGTIQPIAELTAVARAHDVPFHTDAVQAAGWLDLDVGRLGVQALSLSGHKVGAPKGVGVLWVARRTPIEPLIHGGGQQRGLRSGTEDVAGAVGMATALRLARTADPAPVIARAATPSSPGWRGRCPERPADGPPGREAARSRLVRAPGRQRRVGAARPRAARRDLLQRLRLRGGERRTLPRTDRDGHPHRDRPDRAAVHLRGRRHRRGARTRRPTSSWRP